jgi:hypothetical protein
MRALATDRPSFLRIAVDTFAQLQAPATEAVLERGLAESGETQPLVQKERW